MSLASRPRLAAGYDILQNVGGREPGAVEWAVFTVKNDKIGRACPPRAAGDRGERGEGCRGARETCRHSRRDDADGHAVKVTPFACDRVWCAFDVELTKPGERTVRVKACDFQSAGDEPLSRGANAFSIWF